MNLCAKLKINNKKSYIFNKKFTILFSPHAIRPNLFVIYIQVISQYASLHMHI